MPCWNQVTPQKELRTSLKMVICFCCILWSLIQIQTIKKFLMFHQRCIPKLKLNYPIESVMIHITSFCHHPSRYVKCGEIIPQTVTPPQKKKKSSPSKCVLCKDDHTSNHKDCPKYKLFRCKTTQSNHQNTNIVPTFPLI